uniref:Uncharacterized protein n=1 Tax=Anguilla anguilla TaxID=7936 RepID=A0A0E9SJI8_ANGAN
MFAVGSRQEQYLRLNCPIQRNSHKILTSPGI